MMSQTLQIFTLLAVSIIAADVPSSQALSGFPSIPGLPDLTGLNKCAVTCTMSAYTSAMQACPVMTDFACFCNNQDFVANSKACIVSSCPLDFIPQAAAFASKMCASVGVTLPDSVTAKPASFGSAPSAPIASTASSAPIASTASSALTATPTNVPAPQAALNSTAYGVASNNPAANAVPVTSTLVASIPAPTNAVNTPVTGIQANSSTVVKPAATKPSSAPTSPALQTSSSNSNGTQASKDDESSTSTSIQATATFMILTTVAVLFLL